MKTLSDWVVVFMIAVDLGGILFFCWILLAQYIQGPPKKKVIKDTAHPDTKIEMVSAAVKYWMSQSPEE